MRKLSEAERGSPLSECLAALAPTTTGESLRAHKKGLILLGSVGVVLCLVFLFPSPQEKTLGLEKGQDVSVEEEVSDPGGIVLGVPSQSEDVKTQDFSAEGRDKSAEKAPTKKAVAEVKSKPIIVVKEIKATPFVELFAKADERLEVKAWKKALAVYNLILRKDPKNEKALDGKIYVLEQIASEGALDVLDTLARQYPRKASIYAARARILIGKNDTLEALKAWEKAVKLDPDQKDYRLGLAVLNDRLGREAEALALYGQVQKPLPPEAQKRVEFLKRRSN